MFPTFSLGISWLNLDQIRAQASSLEQTSAYSETDKTLTGSGEPTLLSVASVTDGFFEELGVTSQIGRLLIPDDVKAGQNFVVVISDSLWRTRFGADPKVLGKTLVLDKQPYTIVGVAAPRFTFPSSEQAWIPFFASAADRQNAKYFMLQTIGKLRVGEKPEKLNAQLDSIAQQFMKDHPEVGAYRFSSEPLLSSSVSESRDAFLMLLAAATFVLLIACANLASLLLARGSGRQREMALRAALGASRGRLLRQGLVESCLLALIGGVLGIVLAAQGVELFRAIAPPDTPRLSEISVDSTLLWFSVLTSLIAGVLFGIVPARRASRMDPNEALKEGTGSNLGAARSGRQSRLGNALVTLEVALAFVLVVGSVLMTLTLSRLLHQNPGFRTDHLLSFDLPQPTGVPSEKGKDYVKQQSNHLREVVEKVRRHSRRRRSHHLGPRRPERHDDAARRPDRGRRHSNLLEGEPQRERALCLSGLFSRNGNFDVTWPGIFGSRQRRHRFKGRRECSDGSGILGHPRRCRQAPQRIQPTTKTSRPGAK